MTDDTFLDHVADRLAVLPGVRAVALGGSRAQGTHGPDSDWDFAVNRVLRGDLPRPDYPQALRDAAPAVWRERASLTLMYAKGAYAGRGQAAETAGALAVAAMYTAHAVLAARGEWVTNEKRLLERAGLRGIDAIVTGLRPDADALAHAVAEAEALFERLPRNVGAAEV